MTLEAGSSWICFLLLLGAHHILLVARMWVDKALHGFDPQTSAGTSLLPALERKYPGLPSLGWAKLEAGLLE